MKCLPAAVLAIFLAAATGLAAGTLDDLETALNNMELRFWTDIYDLGSGRDFLNNANAVRESEARLRQVFQLTRKLQGELRERGIDPLQFPVAQAGSTLFDIWRQNRNLSNQMRNRRVFRQEQPLSRDHLGMIMMTGVAHRDPEQGDYEAWLSDVVARNTELFYPEPLREWREYFPPVISSEFTINCYNFATKPPWKESVPCQFQEQRDYRLVSVLRWYVPPLRQILQGQFQPWRRA